MFTLLSYPPDPALVGERWRAMWLERLENEPLLIDTWLRISAATRFWQAGLGLRGLRRHHRRGLRRRRLGRRLQQRRSRACSPDSKGRTRVWSAPGAHR